MVKKEKSIKNDSNGQSGLKRDEKNSSSLSSLEYFMIME